MTTPIKPGTRYDMTASPQGGDELKQLEDLINFIGNVKDTARLRAKEEQGVRFLHTRTGTPLGRFWKWLAVGWPGAMKQRMLFKASVESVLKNIQSSDGDDITLMKNRISGQTLAVRMLKEFDIHQLRNDLRVLKALVKSRQNESSQTSVLADSSMVNKPPAMILIAKQKPSGSEEESLDEPVSGAVEVDSGSASLASVGKTAGTATLTDTRAVGTQVLKTMAKEGPPSHDGPDEEHAEIPSLSVSAAEVSFASIEMPIQQAFEAAELPAEPRLAAPKLAVLPEASAIDPTWPESRKAEYQAPPPQPQPQRLKSGPSAVAGSSSSPGKNSSAEKSLLSPTPTAPAESKIAAGKLEVFPKANSGSRYAVIGLLEAEAYIFPSGGNANNPNEKLLVESVKPSADGMQAFRGKLESNASSRSWGMLVMEGPSSLTDEQKWNALYTRYKTTLEAAIALRIDENKPVRTIAIRPWKDRLLSDVAAQTLVRAANSFREQHREITLLIVPSAEGEVRKLQTAIDKVGKESTPPFA